MGTKIVQTECNGKSNLFEFAIAEVQPILFKDSANLKFILSHPVPNPLAELVPELVEGLLKGC